ncbi:MAG: FecR domain-containing protein [Pseudomonadota bacterium]
MNDSGHDDVQREAIEEQAVAWFIRMRGPHSKSDEAMLRAWLDEAPEHRSTYAWAEQHFGSAALLKESTRHGRQRRTKPGFQLISAAIAASFVAVIALGVIFRPGDRPFESSQLAKTPQALRTLSGQIYSTDLGGGIQVVMDADSGVTVSISDTERRLRLEGGRARVSVQHDSRPFIMEAGDGELFTQAGSFDIGRSNEGRIEIAVLSGEVELRKLLRPAILRAGSRRFKAGQSLAYRSGDTRSISLTHPAIDYRDWPDGWAEYRSVPLSILTADANKYALKPIHIEGAGLGELRVSGRFRLTQTDLFTARIAELFNLRVDRKADGNYLTRSE